MSHEDQIELRDRMILSLASHLHPDPKMQRAFVRLAEDDARDAMAQPIFLAVDNERRVS